jgi:hypothetical protein
MNPGGAILITYSTNSGLQNCERTTLWSNVGRVLRIVCAFSYINGNRRWRSPSSARKSPPTAPVTPPLTV